jgi:hypothetical protein
VAETAKEKGKIPDATELERLVVEEFYLPLANKPAFDRMIQAGRRLVRTYVDKHQSDLRRVWEVERPFELHLPEGIVTGRADVILDEEGGKIGCLAVVDYKIATDKERDDILVNQFNEKYSSDGYEAKLLAYDILSEEKFSRVFLGLPTTKTWFFGLELHSRALRERFMFYFQHDLRSETKVDEGSIVLRLSRYDGDEYRNLTADVFQPCQLGWQDGSVLFNWPNEIHRNKPLRYQVRLLFAELIRAFLEQPGARSAA